MGLGCDFGWRAIQVEKEGFQLGIDPDQKPPKNEPAVVGMDPKSDFGVWRHRAQNGLDLLNSPGDSKMGIRHEQGRLSRRLYPSSVFFQRLT
jgi:hypothetical protein